MSIPFDMPDTDGVNAANPCCCPEPACPYPTVEFQNRDLQVCKGGFQPFMTSSVPPGEFDLSTRGNLIPLYKRKTETATVTKAGTLSETWQYASGMVVSETFVFNAAVNYSATDTVASEYGKREWEWPAGSEPLGPCPPESAIMPASASASGVSIGTAEDGIVPVTLSTPDVRPNHPTETEEDGSPSKAGYFEWTVDGSWSGTTSGPSLLIHLTEGDDTCHEFTVRHVCGGNGAWSVPKVFSLTGNRCCKDPEPMDCNGYTEGNVQWGETQAYRAGGGNTWNASYSNTGGGSSSDSGTGYGDTCDGDSISNIPGGISGIFTPRPALEFIFSGSDGYTYARKRTVSTDTTTETWAVNTSTTTPDDGSTGWWVASSSESGTASSVVKIELSEDQNQGATSANSMFAEALSAVNGYTSTFGWGITISGGDFPSQAASAVAGWPETEDGGYLGTLFVKLRQQRFRWEISPSFDGEMFRVTWSLARFDDRWLEWKSAYYAWALAKFEFLNKPKRGDDAYPKLADFWDDPETAPNEARELLDAAIAAINAIPDPGSAPEEPTDAKPHVIEETQVWLWTSGQAERDDERVDACDPTYKQRVPQEPEKPLAGDYETPAAYQAALAAYETALQSFRDAAAERREASKRQSPWFLLTPDKWRHWSEKPTEPSLPEDPTEEQRDEYERDMKRYRFLLNRYNTTPHGAVYVCNVRHTCNLGDPAGEIENWDRNFLTTELPPLDPTKEDPAIWADWYQ